MPAPIRQCNISSFRLSACWLQDIFFFLPLAYNAASTAEVSNLGVELVLSEQHIPATEVSMNNPKRVQIA